MKRFAAVLLAAVLGFAALGCEAEKESRPALKPVASQARTDLVDINRASAEELMALKGIGEARARAIIKGRPYARKDELVHRKIIPQSVYDGIKDQIVAKQK